MLWVKGYCEWEKAVNNNRNKLAGLQFCILKKKYEVIAFTAINIGCRGVSQYWDKEPNIPCVEIKIMGWSTASIIANNLVKNPLSMVINIVYILFGAKKFCKKRGFDFCGKNPFFAFWKFGCVCGG